MIMDQIISIRLITAAGEVLELDSSSEGEELALFHALCGAGHGLGVVTSMNLKAFPLAALRMKNDEVWCRRVTFPADAIDLAAEKYKQLLPPKPAQYVLLMFAREPVTSSAPGAPIIILSSLYYGPEEEGEQASKPLFDDAIVNNITIHPETVSTPLSQMNEAWASFSAHGEYKDISSAWLRTTPVETMKASFQQYVQFTDQYKDATRSTIVHATHNPRTHMAISETAEGQAKYFESRDRGTCMLVMPWTNNPETVEPMRAFAKRIKALYRKAQPDSDVPRTFPNNMQSDTQLEELHTVDRIKELKRIKKLWDESNVFWSPYRDKRKQ